MIDRRFLTVAFLLLGGSQAFGQIPKSGARAVAGAAPIELVEVTRLSDPYMPPLPSDDRYHPLTAQPPPAFDPDAKYGFRNPGGVGRVREFYPPGNVFERGDDRVRTARFDNGPTATSRQYQMMAQRIGNERARTLNSQISAYGRPLNFGWGYGSGYGFGGSGYGYGSRFPY